MWFQGPKKELRTDSNEVKVSRLVPHAAFPFGLAFDRFLPVLCIAFLISRCCGVIPTNALIHYVLVLKENKWCVTVVCDRWYISARSAVREER